MKRKLLEIIHCPSCKNNLTLRQEVIEKGEVRDGKLVCASCKKEYRIENYIPRFIDTDKYVNNFSFEWKTHCRTQLDSISGTGESERTFKLKTGFDLDQLKGKMVLDVGCGMGRFSEIVIKHGGEVVGIDLSYAVESAFDNLGLKANANFMQADVFNLPFKEGSFDYIFSLGVLHHTPDTRKAFEQLPALLKKNGEIAIWVYSNVGFRMKMYNAASGFFRLFTTRMPQKMLYSLCYVAIPLYYVKKVKVLGKCFSFLPTSMHPIPEWRVLDTFDWYSPKYQWKHTYSQVREWFEKSGLREIKELEFPVSIKAKK
jgi:SAM-dependent methyltransferase